MRPSPPLQVTIECFGIWRSAVGLSMVIVAATTVAWLASLHDDALGGSHLARWGVGLLTVVGIASAATLMAPRSVSLRWDGQRWHLGAVASVGNEPDAGELRVAIDVGAWMLLRFDGDAVGRKRIARWIPVQRQGLESVWHALRCAVYSPRPKSGELLDSAFSPPVSTRSNPAE